MTTPDRYTPSRAAPVARRRDVAHASLPTRTDGVHANEEVGHLLPVVAQASLSKATADTVVNAVFSAITGALARGETVTIAGFDAFSTKVRSARQGRNPLTGKSITIAASTAPSFKASKTLRDAVN